MATPLHRYHFNLGNSHTGAVGACCEVMAESRQDAVAVLRRHLGGGAAFDCRPGALAVTHLSFFLNAEQVTDADIDQIDGQDVPPPDEPS